MPKTPHLLDVVALLADQPAHGLLRGQVGTVVEILDGASNSMTGAGVPRLVVKRILNHSEAADITGVYESYSYDREKKKASTSGTGDCRRS